MKDLGLSQATKSRIVAALHICKQHNPLETILKDCDVVDIAKAVKILDLRRSIHQTERKVKSIAVAHPHLLASDLSTHEKEQAPSRRNHKCTKRKKRKPYQALCGKLKYLQGQQQELAEGNPACQHGNDDDGSVELITSCSVSGAFARKVRSWANQLTADFLEFVLLTMPLQHWKTLSDLVHFAPTDFTVPYFLSVVHGGQVPPGSLVASLQQLASAKHGEVLQLFQATAKEHPQIYLSYAFLRSNSALLSNTTIANELAANIPLGTALWYFEELAHSSTSVAATVLKRLETEGVDTSSKTMASFGKLLERILLCRNRKEWNAVADALVPLASARLEDLQSQWGSAPSSEKTTIVLGDASASMQRAIEGATILATMISVCFDGELSFFQGTSIASPYPKPRTVDQTLTICSKVRAGNCTSLAAALYPYFEKKQKVDQIFMVTDEQENTACEGYRFAGLLRKYKETVHPDVCLVVISVGAGCCQFRSSLAKHGIDYKRIQIDDERADLTKFDSILSQLVVLSSRNVGGSEETVDEDFIILDS